MCVCVTSNTRDTRAHAGTDEPHNQPPKPKRTQTRTKTARITRTNLTTIHPNPTTQTRTETATDSTAARTVLYRYCRNPKESVSVADDRE